MIKLNSKYKIRNFFLKLIGKSKPESDSYLDWNNPVNLEDEQLLDLLLESPDQWKDEWVTHKYSLGSYKEHAYYHNKYKVKIGIDYSPFGEIIYIYINNFKDAHDLSYNTEFMDKVEKLISSINKSKTE